ncbi:hypothetical protein ACWD1Z_10650 [Streptomyces sp. NPDC002784]
MGIESDQVVYEYLSRVGDVAQQRQLPSGTRMRLVSELRNEIDRRRARVPVDSPAAVRRIIARLGTPDEVVTAAGGAGAPQAPPASVPVQPDRAEKRPRRIVPRPRPAEADDAVLDVPSSPHLASTHELGDSAAQPDWWRVDSSPFGVGDEVPGFVGGVEIPELLRPPPPREEKRPAEAPAVVGKGLVGKDPVEKDLVEEEAAPRRRRFGVPLPAAAAWKTWRNPLLLLAAALLLTGAGIGNLVVLIFGWLLAYGSRRLTDAEKKGAVVVLPALAVTAGVVWLWGRTEGRWGDPIAEGHMSDAVAETWPWVVRGAAVASALYLVWRSQRRR